VAYGNAASDLPHLKLADRGVLVNGARGARELAKRDGVICVDWN
jgi:phosphoserine phosphatase